MNDIGYILFIIILFAALGLVMPFISQDITYNSQAAYAGGNYSNIYDGSEIEDINTAASVISLGNIVKSVALMFFWTFGQLPVWIDAFLTVIRITLALLIYRLIRSGGG